MGEIMPSAVLHQQVQTDEIRQTRTMLEAIVPGYRATRGKFGSSEEIADFLCVGGCSRRAGRQAGGSCGHHEQVNRKAEWPIRGLLGPVGDTTFFFFSLAAGSLFQPSRSVEFASSAGYTDWQWLGGCF